MPTLEVEHEAHGECVYQPSPADIVRVTPLTAADTLFEIDPPRGAVAAHAPGQFMQVSVMGVGECPISICTSPTRPERLGLCIRRVGEVTAAIHKLRAGDVLGLRGPYGRGFDVNALHGSNLLIVAGGCALAPARSLIQYVLDRRERFDEFHVLYGARSPAEILFSDEVAEWQRSRQIACHVTVDHPDASWSGAVGVVTRLFEQLPALDPAATTAVVIGPPVMFRFAVAEVLKLGVAPPRIFCSLERRMKCGVGKCGHCQVNQVYVCQDGPVFTYDELRRLPEAMK